MSKLFEKSSLTVILCTLGASIFSHAAQASFNSPQHDIKDSKPLQIQAAFNQPDSLPEKLRKSQSHRQLFEGREINDFFSFIYEYQNGKKVSTAPIVTMTSSPNDEAMIEVQAKNFVHNTDLFNNNSKFIPQFGIFEMDDDWTVVQ